ncbi:MAG TPA: PEP-CTERM sorting domain-containing protein [Acidobacteriaceae bacterium]|nr:PEP-CTERM sorting domain-containing protein [Acidobacteriaceae bacterium]
MKRLALAMSVLALAMLPASSAFADTFDFNFTGNFFSGSGVFTADYQSGDQWLITGITGQVNGYTIDALLAPGSYPTGLGQSPNDNILIFPGEAGFNSPKFFDHDGVSFELVGGTDVNLNDTLGFENGVATPYHITELTDVSVTQNTPSPAPEPESLVLLGTGVLGIAGAMRRKIAARVFA